jgi:hypothetical protein
LKTIFTSTLPPTEHWFNAIQNLKFNGGCQDGEYAKISWPSLNSGQFKSKYYSTNATDMSRVQFVGGLKVPLPSTTLSPINNAYLQSTLSANQLNVTAPGTWILYRQGVLSCPKRARVTADFGLETVTTVFGLKVSTWLIAFSPNTPQKNGVAFGANFFTISGVPTEPYTVTISRNPLALGGQVDTVGYNYVDWQHDPATSSLRINLPQNIPYFYSIVAVF